MWNTKSRDNGPKYRKVVKSRHGYQVNNESGGTFANLANLLAYDQVQSLD